MLFIKPRLIIHSLLFIALLAGIAGATITVNATISTYAAFASQNAGATPGLLIFMESSNNDYNYAGGVQWVTINQNKTYTFTLPSAGYYWTGFNNNNASQASSCSVSGLNSITGSGTYIADGATVTMTITCTEPDVTPPVISSAVVNSAGTTLTLTYNESVESSYATASEFIITAGGSAVSVTSVTYTGSTVVLHLGSTIAKNKTVTVSFDNSYEELVDNTYNAAASLSNYAVTNNSTVIVLTSQTITFANPGAQNFGTTPTLSASSTSTLDVSFTSSTTNVCTITSAGALTFLTIGTCTINADQAGNASYAAATTVSRSFTVNAVAPEAPTIGTATAGDAQAMISFTAPASNGGATITSYTVTSNPGDLTASGSSSPLTVTGLTNGTSYTFTVTATNSAGESTASAASNAVTPKGMQTITFANPGAQNFGTTPTLSATSTSLLAVEFTSSTTNVCTITSAGALTFLATGTCTINADQAGNSTYAAATTVSRSFTVNAVAPGAPTIGTATAGDAQATISFTAPASNGGAAITSYTMTSNPGNLTASGSASPLTVTGLTNGTSYTFTVTATNSIGTSVASEASNAVTPKGAQTITFAAFTDVTYGDADFAPDAEASSGLSLSFTSDNESVAKITDAGLVQIIGAGNATITASQVGNSAYETATTVSHDLTVVKAPLTISVQNDTISEGDSDPIFQFTFVGFVNGDETSDLTDLTATRDLGTTAGNYTITPSASSTNYDLDFVNGTLTIETTTSILVLGSQNISVRPVQGGFSLTGLRGNLEIFTLRGEHVQSLRVNHDGVYAVNLKAGSYVLRLGPWTWTLSSSIDR